MVADPGVGVGIDRAALVERLVREFGPREARRREDACDVEGLLTGVEARLRLDVRVVVGEEGGLRAQLRRVEIADVRGVTEVLTHALTLGHAPTPGHAPPRALSPLRPLGRPRAGARRGPRRAR